MSAVTNPSEMTSLNALENGKCRLWMFDPTVEKIMVVQIQSNTFNPKLVKYLLKTDAKLDHLPLFLNSDECEYLCLTFPAALNPGELVRSHNPCAERFFRAAGLDKFLKPEGPFIMCRKKYNDEGMDTLLDLDIDMLEVAKLWKSKGIFDTVPNLGPPSPSRVHVMIRRQQQEASLRVMPFTPKRSSMLLSKGAMPPRPRQPAASTASTPARSPQSAVPVAVPTESTPPMKTTTQPRPPQPAAPMPTAYRKLNAVISDFVGVNTSPSKVAPVPQIITDNATIIGLGSGPKWKEESSKNEEIWQVTAKTSEIRAPSPPTHGGEDTNFSDMDDEDIFDKCSALFDPCAPCSSSSPVVKQKGVVVRCLAARHGIFEVMEHNGRSYAVHIKRNPQCSCINGPDMENGFMFCDHIKSVFLYHYRVPSNRVDLFNKRTLNEDDLGVFGIDAEQI